MLGKIIKGATTVLKTAKETKRTPPKSTGIDFQKMQTEMFSGPSGTAAGTSQFGTITTKGNTTTGTFRSTDGKTTVKTTVTKPKK